jgi:prepilin-type processing-associated H-X9-DG protein
VEDHFVFVNRALAVPGDAAAYYPNSFFSQTDVLRHLGSANYLFVDGHVESIAWTRVKPMLKQTGSRFVKPDGNP